MSIINPKVSQVFAGDTQQQKFIAAALEQLLGEEKTEALISEILPQEIKPSPKFKGQPLVMFNGLTRKQLKEFHKLTDTEVDEVFKLMGVTENAVKSEVTVNKEQIEKAGTGTENTPVTAPVKDGQSEKEVDTPTADKPLKQAVPVKATQVKK